jgi:hypothetical protein
VAAAVSEPEQPQRQEQEGEEDHVPGGDQEDEERDGQADGQRADQRVAGLGVGTSCCPARAADEQTSLRR